MLVKYAFLTIILFFFNILTSQDMKEGFGYLERGELDKAVPFFEAILEKYPENKTANICYARAIGLSSDPEKGMNLFKTMDKKHPNDLEVMLNYAESMLWNKLFDKAKLYYEDLLKNYPDNFVANLGYANTLSNLKFYPKALQTINYALELSPKNPGALTSRKYIRLGYASALSTDQKYQDAEAHLQANLDDFTWDRETLISQANLYLVTKETQKAQTAYVKLMTTQKDSVFSHIGLALVAHMEKDEKKALNIAEKAVELADIYQDEKLKKSAYERYVQALMWNRKFDQAESQTDLYKEQFPEDNWVDALYASLGLYKSDFEQSIGRYKTILSRDSLSFDGNLGIANAYNASGRVDHAYKALKQTLDIFINQKDAKNFLGNLDLKYTPYIEEKLVYSFDNGDNYAQSSQTDISIPASTKLSFSGMYKYRETENKTTLNSAKTNEFLIGSTYQIHRKANLTARAGMIKAESMISPYTQYLIEINSKFKIIRFQDAEVGYKREIQSFNADLISENIGTNHFYLNHNISTLKKFGWFTQYFYTTQTDQNARHLLFTSLYYNFKTDPVLKSGFNYQYISFKNQRPLVYFSPNMFNAVEVFLDFLKDENQAKERSIYYSLNLATGLQYIETNDAQQTYRVQCKIGYKASNRLLMHIYGLRSNIASATIAGFTYNEFGFRLKWYFTKKPLFKTPFVKQLEKDQAKLSLDQ